MAWDSGSDSGMTATNGSLSGLYEGEMKTVKPENGAASDEEHDAAHQFPTQDLNSESNSLFREKSSLFHLDKYRWKVAKYL